MSRAKTKSELMILQEIDRLPKGTIVRKTIRGRQYYYHQWYEGGKTKSLYLSDKDYVELTEALYKRGVLKSKLENLRNGDTEAYLLMHQNNPVGEYTVRLQTGEFLFQNKLYHPELLPIGVHSKGGQTDLEELNTWFIHRIVPNSRDMVYQLLMEYDLRSPGGLALLSHGLNLVDQYWVRPISENILYEDIHFFDRPFSEQVGDFLLEKNIDTPDLSSPDISTNGDLRKAWRIISGKQVLFKGHSGSSRNEPFNEVIASRILDLLGLPHVHYELQTINEIPFSSCENFVSKEVEFVDALQIMKSYEVKEGVSYYHHFLYCCDKLGIHGAREYLDRLLAFDYIIGNEDRHFGNFGALRDARTLEFIGMSPIYDNGSSFAFRSPLFQIKQGREVPSKPFMKTHRDQIKLVSTFDWLNKDALKEVPKILTEVYRVAIEGKFLTTERANAIIEETKARIDELIAYIDSKSK